MNDPTGIDQVTRDAADATARNLAIAKAVYAKAYPSGGAVDSLLPALLIAASIARASAAISGQLNSIAAAIAALSASMCEQSENLACDLGEKLDGIENEANRSANILSAAEQAGAFSPRQEARCDGGK